MGDMAVAEKRVSYLTEAYAPTWKKVIHMGKTMP